MLHLNAKTIKITNTIYVPVIYLNMWCAYLFPFSSILDAVIYYDWLVPEGERHDSALKRNKDTLIAELKLWEDYLEKVVYVHYTWKSSNTASTCFYLFWVLSLSSWDRTLSWQDSPSHWQMWLFFQLLPLFFVLGESDAFLLHFLEVMQINQLSVMNYGSETSPFLFCSLSAERYPKLGHYHTMLKDRPSIKASWPPHWLENPTGQEGLKDIWNSFQSPRLPCFGLFSTKKRKERRLSKIISVLWKPKILTCSCKFWGEKNQLTSCIIHGSAGLISWLKGLPFLLLTLELKVD